MDGEGSTLSGDEAQQTSTGAGSSSGTDSGGLFSPAGLRVLVVDDDPMCLKVVSAMLQRCSYEVDTRASGHDALSLLRERQEQNHQFDLVLSDVYMPDMDGFKLLECIGLELDLPVIMMSSNGDTNVVLRGVTHGAVDFLIKPVRVEELRNVWQHVVRRRSIHVGRTSDEHSGLESDQQCSGGLKRKESEALQVQHETQGANKKPRVVWSVEMHQQFVDAVSQLGVDKAVPKRILDLMNVEGLTRENVASHLQKYRLYLKRAQGLQNGKGSKGHKAAQEAALLDPQAAAAAAAVAAGAGPGSVFAQVAAQQAAMGPSGSSQAQHTQQPAGSLVSMGSMGHHRQHHQPAAAQPVPGMPPHSMPVMGMPGASAAASMAAAAAWQQQTMAMQAAAAAAAASGALPGAMPPSLPFPMPPGTMMPPHVAAAMAAGMPMQLMGPPAALPGMDGSFASMVYHGQQHQQAVSMRHAAPPPAATQQEPSRQQQQQQQPAVKEESPVMAHGFPSASAANANAVTEDSCGIAANGLDHHAHGGDNTDHSPLPVADLQVPGGLGDTESLMNALNADSFLSDVPPLPRLDAMDDFLSDFLSSDKGLEECL